MNKDDDLVLFFFITMLWTWGFGFAPFFLGISETPLGNFLFYFGGGAPSVVALFIVFLRFNKNQKQDYFNRIIRFGKLELKWFGFTVAFFSTISIVGLIISTQYFAYEMPQMQWMKIILDKPYSIPLFLFLSFISGPLNEEFGWRGYALDRLITRMGTIKASLVLGIIWALWHLPWYFIPGQAQYKLVKHSFLDGFMFIPSTIALSFIVTFVYIKTDRSILSGALVHMMSNFITGQLLIPMNVEVSSIIRYVCIAFCMIVIIYMIKSDEFKDYNVPMIE